MKPAWVVCLSILFVIAAYADGKYSKVELIILLTNIKKIIQIIKKINHCIIQFQGFDWPWYMSHCIVPEKKGPFLIVFDKPIFPLLLVGYEMIIVN